MNIDPAPGVIVLAGDRRPDDPLARAHGVEGKALVPVAGRALLTRVLDRLAELPRRLPVLVVAPDRPAYRAAAEASRVPAEALRWQTPSASPAASVAAALDLHARPQGTLLVTGDHPLLQPHWLEALAAGGEAAFADLAVALVPWPRVQARFPEGRRTQLKLADGALCGTNLFWLRTPGALPAVKMWQRVERHRKRPWLLATMLGPRLMGAYATGRLEREHAFELLSRRAGARVRSVLLDDGESAVDVDSAADLALVAECLAARALHR